MASQLTFLFGIEIELLIGSRGKSHKSWKSLASEVSSKLMKAGIMNHISDSASKATETYEEWSIIQEVTVPSQPGKNLWGIELVSPIFDTSSHWEAHLSILFKTLKSGFILTPSSNTSTHIHLSTTPPLPPTHLSALAKCILYFEPALDALFPASRASSYWVQSNRSNPLLKRLSLSQAFAYLDTYCATDTAAVAQAMCSFPASSPYGRAHGFESDFVHGVYKWDFSGLVDPSVCASTNETPHGTVEFRQCPGSSTAEEARGWVLLAVGFAAGAMMDPAAGVGAGVVDPEGLVSVEELWWLVTMGIQSLGIGGGDVRPMEKLFGGGKKGKSGRK